MLAFETHLMFYKRVLVARKTIYVTVDTWYWVI